VAGEPCCFACCAFLRCPSTQCVMRCWACNAMHSHKAQRASHAPAASCRPTAWSAPADDHAVLSILTHAAPAELRRQAWLARCCTPADNVGLFQELAGARHEMAALMGFPSYAHYQVGEGHVMPTNQAR
jgi:Zn-dependent oligopeptidase